MITTVDTRAGKRYRVRVGLGAPQRTFSRIEDARDYETEARRDRKRAHAGLPPRRSAITYDELCNLYLEATDASEWTQYMLGYSRKKFGKQLLNTMRPEKIGAWLNSLTYSDKTKSHILERMRAVLTQGVEWGYLERSPARPTALRLRTGSRVREVRPLSHNQLLGLCGHLETQLERSFAHFAFFTGLRVPSEIMRVEWRDIDRRKKTIRVRGTKTQAAARTIPLMSLAENSLRNIEREYGKVAGPIFAAIDYPNWRRSEWRTAVRDVGLDVTPYELRHSFATHALTRGIPLDVVAEWLGHKDLAVTKTYYARYVTATHDLYRKLFDKGAA